MSKRLVIALGGNALGKTPQEQLDLVKGTASTIVDLVEEGYDVVIGHGNGPQVGMVNLAFEYSANNGGGTPAMPFPECGAMTQGYIGYHLQQAVERELARRGINKPCAAVVTQVVVDKNDDAFQKPTKPVGMSLVCGVSGAVLPPPTISFIYFSFRVIGIIICALLIN